jgi:ADP-ribosylglycohydrolase
MLGAIAGDIIGSVHEFSNNEDDTFELFVAGSSPTDDSILTTAIAQACLDGSTDYKRYILEGVTLSESPKTEPPLGPTWGSGFYDWVIHGAKGLRDSYGNGSAMRVSPVAWAYDKESDVVKHAELTALNSHAHEEGIRGAQATAHCIWVARTTKDPEAVRRVAQRYYPTLPELDVIRREHDYNETCQGCVPECIAIATHTQSYEQAVRFACSIRGDADTLGAIAGSISQALWGIPLTIRTPALTLAKKYYPWIATTTRKFENKFGK